MPKPKTNTRRDTGDPHFDLIKVFEQRDIGTMYNEELEKRITMLQQMRLVRVTTSKKPTALDVALASITMDNARQYLEVLEKRESEKSNVKS